MLNKPSDVKQQIKMELTDIDESTLEELDNACGGVFSLLKEYCLAHDYKAHLTIQTHLEGLENGQMKMYITVVKDGNVIDHAVGNMNAAAQIIGWNLYLHDILTSVRLGLSRVVL